MDSSGAIEEPRYSTTSDEKSPTDTSGGVVEGSSSGKHGKKQHKHRYLLSHRSKHEHPEDDNRSVHSIGDEQSIQSSTVGDPLYDNDDPKSSVRENKSSFRLRPSRSTNMSLPKAIKGQLPEFHTPFAQQANNSEPSWGQLARSATESDLRGIEVDDEFDREALNSPRLSTTSSITTAGGEKKRTFSAIPRLRNALSHVHLHSVSRPASSGGDSGVQSGAASVSHSTQSSPRLGAVNSQMPSPVSVQFPPPAKGGNEGLYITRTTSYGSNGNGSNPQQQLGVGGNPDSRRPSYASVNTKSSTGSRLSQDDKGMSNLAEFDLELAELPASSIPSGAANPNNMFHKVQPMSFPDPEQVFDTKGYLESQNASAKLADGNNASTSRPASIASASSDTQKSTKKHKKTFLGKLMSSRRESSAESEKSSHKSSHNHNHNNNNNGSSNSNNNNHNVGPSFLRTRYSTSTLPSGTVIGPKNNDLFHGKGPFRSSRPREASSHSLGFAFHKSNTNLPSSPSGSVGKKTKRSGGGDLSRRSSREASVDLGDLDVGKTFPLDTDLGEMSGIVKTDVHVPDSSNIAATIEETNHLRKESQWAAPESWAVPKDPPLTEDALWSNAPPNGANSGVTTGTTVATATTASTTSSAPKKPNYFLRVFREDGTFGTVSCPLYATVSELIQTLGKKFFLNSVAGYKLSVRSGGLTRLLQPNERPVLLQKILLEFMGYTERDRIAELGREDMSYLCRFEFSKSPLKQYKDNRYVTRDFSVVYLRDMSLQTIPVIFFQHVAEIESLDVSENPSLTLPLDFIQACVRLKDLRYVNNHCLQFPTNIAKTLNLTHLDLSNNLLISLDNMEFEELPHLISLNLQGNRLTSLPDKINLLDQLKILNMSSNNLTHVNPALCEINSLIELDFSFNRIEELPDEIGKLTLLEKLGMTNNYLSKELPSTFNNLQSLIELDVRYNKLQNIDILSELPRLSMLYCSKNSVHTFQHSFHRLSMFYFDRNPITKIFFNEPLHSLTVLNLRKAKLTVLSDEFLSTIPLIERLVLDGNHLVTLPSGIGNLKKLLYLSIVGNELSSLPVEIGHLKELRTLDLHSNNLKMLPQEIWGLSSLMVLNISSNLLDSFPKPNFHIGSIGSGDSMGHGLYKSLTVSGGDTRRDDFIDSYELKTVDDYSRRPSVMSVQSIPSPKDISSRRVSMYPPLQPIASYDETESTTTATTATTATADLSPKGRPCLAHSLSILRAADNRFNDDCYQELSLLSELQVLNLSYNDLVDIPYGALGRLTRLRELFLSGNNLSSLPADDFQSTKALRVFYVNSNKLHSLPAEVGKITHLQVFDVGSNNLRYNINNWPYDWNWNWNRELKYLNFSGNRRLEIKNMHSNTSHSRGEDSVKNLSDFTVLNNLRVLGLMDVTLMTPSVPDQTENCRVRTYGSEILTMSYGMADSLGAHDNLSTMDLVIERFRGNEKEAIIGLFDGRNKNREGGNKVSKLIQETFGNIFDTELSKLREGEGVADALRRAFLSTNKEIGNTTMLPTEEIARTFIAHRSSTAANLEPDDRSTGSCATIVYINDSRMFVANVGDTMALLSKGNGDYTVLTTRHDPTSKEELERIRGGAGVVSSDGRLDDVLDVSRAIGFYNLIPHIHAAPSIAEYDLTDADDFLILASKQLWEYVTFEMAVDIARMEIEEPMLAAQKLRDFAIAYGCNDKIMVMVIGVGGFRKNTKYKSSNIHLGSIPGAEEELFPSLLKKRRDKSLLPEDSSLARLGGEVEPPVGDVAMVFTDIKNSTLLWETYPVAMRSAIKTHNALMRRNIRIMGGYEVKTEGDAFIVSFPTPTSALLWCFSVQSQLLVADWPSEILESSEGCPVTDVNSQLIFRGLSVRMGIHWGRPVCEVDVITKRMDYFGPMVNRTARISAVADGGQITLSSDFLSEIKRLDKAHKRVVEGASLVEAYGDETVGESMDRNMKMLHQLGYIVQDLGEMKLKGLENPESICVTYPNSLRGRLEHHEQNRTPEQLKQQTNNFNTLEGKPSTTAAGVETRSEKRPSHPVGHGAARVGGLTIALLVRLRSISNRLEKVCSKLNMPAVDMEAFNEYDKKTTENVVAVVPNTDYDYILFFEQLITRIENALSTLYVRAAANNLANNSSSEETLNALADILKSLSILIKQDRLRTDASS